MNHVVVVSRWISNSGNQSYCETLLLVCIILQKLNFLYSDRNAILRKGLPDSCLLLCQCAISQLSEISTRLETANIYVNEMVTIEHNFEQMKRLCDAADTELTENVQSSNFLKKCLDERQKEYEAFKRMRKSLQNLCDHLKDIDG